MLDALLQTIGVLGLLVSLASGLNPAWPRSRAAHLSNPMTRHPIAIVAEDAPARTKPSHYPEPFASRMAGRLKRPLGDLFGLSNFGVNLTRLAPSASSALHHRHSRQDEFVYVLEGHPTLVAGTQEMRLGPGMVAGFAAGEAAHHLENRTPRDCVILEIGDRSPADEVSYPTEDLEAVKGQDGAWNFVHKDGRSYPR